MPNPTRLFDPTIVGATDETSLELISSLLNASTEYSIVAQGLDGTIQLWNEGARRLYGYEPEEVVGKANAAILHPLEDVASGRAREGMDGALKEGKWEGQLTNVRKSGERFPARVVITPRRDSTGSAIGFLLISKDISEWVKTQDLRRSNAELERFATCALPDSSHLMEVAAELLDSTVRVLVVEDDPVQARLLQARLAPAGSHLELVRASRLSEIPVTCAIAVPDVILLDLFLPDSQGLDTLLQVRAALPAVPIVVVSNSDDSKLQLAAMKAGAQDFLIKGSADGQTLVRAIRHAIERQRCLADLDRSQAQQLATKDQFLSHVGHELRSPLAVAHQFLTLVLDNVAGDVTPEQQDCLETALKHLNQLRTILGDLSEAFRAQTGKLSVEALCGSTVELILDTAASFTGLAERAKVRLEVDLDSYTPPFLGDETRLHQVLTNLIDNALKHTPAGGKIRIEAGAAPDDPGLVRMAVHDTGCGMRTEILGRVFDRLFQENPGDQVSRGGLGLGLYISRELLKLQNGRIWATSEVGKGSSFFLTVPTYPLDRLLTGLAGEGHRDLRLINVVIRCGRETRERRERPLERVAPQALRLVRDLVKEFPHVVLPRVAHQTLREEFCVAVALGKRAAADLGQRIQSALEIWSRSLGNETAAEVAVRVVPVQLEEPASRQQAA